jgi:hypothetical protein
MSADPLGGAITNPQSLNRYAYVINNPLSLIDPSGQLWCSPSPYGTKQVCFPAPTGFDDPDGFITMELTGEEGIQLSYSITFNDGYMPDGTPLIVQEDGTITAPLSSIGFLIAAPQSTGSTGSSISATFDPAFIQHLQNGDNPGCFSVFLDAAANADLLNLNLGSTPAGSGLDDAARAGAAGLAGEYAAMRVLSQPLSSSIYRSILTSGEYLATGLALFPTVYSFFCRRLSRN